MKLDASDQVGEAPESQTWARSREDLVRELQVLRQAVRARDEAIAAAAHDLRSPLNVIALAASALLESPLGAPATRHAERIVDVTRRAAQLVEDLLDVAAIEAGRFTVD